MFSTSFGSVTFTRAKYRIFVSLTLFSKPCSLPFYTTIASNSYIPPTFSLENVFLYLFPLFFIIIFYRLLIWQVPPPPPLRFNYRSSFVCTILNIRKYRHGNASHYALRNDYVYQFYALFIYLIPENVLPGDSKAIGIICALLNHSYPELYLRENN